MKTAEELTTLFRERGLRVTPQRQAIFRLLHGNSTHPTVDALYEAARAEMPTISLKTVYQTVHDLEEMGELELLDVGTGSVRVDPNVEHAHHHLICTRCGMVRDVVVDTTALRVPSRERDGFYVSDVAVHFRGLCAPCADSVAPASARTGSVDSSPGRGPSSSPCSSHPSQPEGGREHDARTQGNQDRIEPQGGVRR